MSDNKVINHLKVGEGVIALQMDGYFIWDCSVIKAGGMYHMFASRWPKKWGFWSSWLFHSEIIHAVSETPEGPYQFQNVVLPRRGREFFDGMNTHNTCIKEHNGKFYLYYMGTTYWGDAPVEESDLREKFALETWNRKRIGIAVADDINGEFVRRDRPLLEPRDCTHWDCTITTNPTVAILPDGKTYMIYKSRRSVGAPLQLGVAVADSPDGEFTRLSDSPILQYENPNIHVEDPYFWYDAERKKFCLIAKDDSKNGDYGITGEWGSGFYAESDDCIHFEIADNPKVYSRKVKWLDGRETNQGHLERPSLLFDENGKPTHLFCASSGEAKSFGYGEDTYVVCMKLKE